MDLLQVGAHCSLPSCNLNDFLPITCKCSNVYCRDHISPENHACSAVSPAYDPSTAAEGDGFDKLRRCGHAGGCNKPSLYAFTTDPGRETCDKCHKAFCVDHRYVDAHSCSPAVPQEPPAPALSNARALLQKNFGSKMGLSSSSSGSSSTRPKTRVAVKKNLAPPTDPVKLAQYNKIQSMKMKQSALPADPKDTPGSVPQSLRLIVKVVFGETERAFWFRNTISTGKAIDLLSTQLKITSSNPIHLLKQGPGDDTTPLRNDLTLAEQATDGDTLILQIDK